MLDAGGDARRWTTTASITEVRSFRFAKVRGRAGEDEQDPERRRHGEGVEAVEHVPEPHDADG